MHDVPVCISTGTKHEKQAKYLFSTDGSHAAALAFVVLVTRRVLHQQWQTTSERHECLESISTVGGIPGFSAQQPALCARPAGTEADWLPCCACRIRRPKDIVNVVMVSTTDGVLENKFVEQARAFRKGGHFPDILP
jgi:hypothetical protein